MLKVSVIIATYNRCESLKTALDSLLNQEMDGSFEYNLIVVDNNSKDATKDVVETCQGSRVRVDYIFEPQQGKVFALNRGIQEAKGDILAFTDDDITADSKWVMSLAHCFKEHDCDGVGGRVLPVYPDNTPQWMKDDQHKMAGVVVIYDQGKEDLKYDGSMDGFIGANYAFKREVFNDVGTFRADIGMGKIPVGEDREFIRRIVAKGKALYYCGKALVWHPVDLTRARFKNVAQWHMTLGRAAARAEIDEGQTFAYCFGVPRYLFKGAVCDAFGILVHIFSKKELFDSLRRFFRKVGMIKEYRENCRSSCIKESRHA